jgi:hypothetical protein
MTLMRSTEGGLHEPDSSDLDDIRATIGPDTFFEMLFREVGGLGLVAAEITDETEDEIQRVRKGRRGTGVKGAHIEQKECTETSDQPTYCRWETYGLPGMTVTWRYALEYAGQLGHVAFRHVECWQISKDRRRLNALVRFGDASSELYPHSSRHDVLRQPAVARCA